MFRMLRWGLGKFEGFWPKKAWENPQGKVYFPPRIFPGFPRMLCIRDWRLKAAGPEAQRRDAWHNSGNNVFFNPSSTIRYWSPEDEVLWFRGAGAEQAPASFPFILYTYTFFPVRRPFGQFFPAGRPRPPGPPGPMGPGPRQCPPLRPGP